MLKVNKRKEPLEFKEYKKKKKPINWEGYDNKIKENLKKSLLKEQEGNCCPYCEVKIHLERSHIEHIKPKDKFPKFLHEYDNMIACCVSNKNCGATKANQWDNLFINPVLDNPEEYFKYDIKTGRILPIDEVEYKFDRAETTIRFLNLNEKNLCDKRKVYILKFRDTQKEYRKFFQEFPSLKRYLQNVLT